MSETKTERLRPVTFPSIGRAAVEGLKAKHPQSGAVIVPTEYEGTFNVQFNGHGLPEAEDAAILWLETEQGYSCYEGGPVSTPQLSVEPEGIAFSRELLEAALRSMSAECFDETDKALLEQVKKAFPLGVTIHTEPEGWLEMVSSLNSLPRLMDICAKVQLAMDEGKLQRKDASLKHPRARCFFDEVNRGIAELTQEMSGEERDKFKEVSEIAIAGMYQLYFGAFKQGLVIGWRAHEIATLSASEEGE